MSHELAKATGKSPRNRGLVNMSSKNGKHKHMKSHRTAEIIYNVKVDKTMFSFISLSLSGSSFLHQARVATK